MNPEEVRKLLGGYATGTLTEAEQQALFAAALEDQELFDELAREQAVRDLLRDPSARAEMLAAVEERPKVWAWWRPAAAALAMAAVAALAVMLPRKTHAPVIVAEVQQPPAPRVPSVESPAATPPATASKEPAPKRKAVEPPAAPPAAAAFAPPKPETPKPEAPKAEPKIQNLSGFAAPIPAGTAGVVGGVPGGVVGGVLGGIVPSTAPPPSPPPPPPPVRMEEVKPQMPQRFAPSSAQTLEVATGQAKPDAARPSARAIFYSRPAAAARVRAMATAGAVAQRTELGLRYSIVSKQGDQFVAADPEDLKQGDVLALRFTSNVNGYLSVAGGTPVALTAMEPYTTPPLDAGVTEARIVFASTPQTSLAGPVALATESSPEGVFVVATTPSTALGFTISLKRK